MSEQKKLRVIFTDKAGGKFSDILKIYGFEENNEETNLEIETGKESKRTIMRETATTVAKKIIPDQNLTEILQKHLQISLELAQKIIADLKSKILPLLLVIPSEKFNDPVFREEISKKVFGEENKKIKETLAPQVKKVEVKNVDKNAEQLKKERESAVQQNTIGQELQKKGPDKYREPIE